MEVLYKLYKSQKKKRRQEYSFYCVYISISILYDQNETVHTYIRESMSVERCIEIKIQVSNNNLHVICTLYKFMK